MGRTSVNGINIQIESMPTVHSLYHDRFFVSVYSCQPDTCLRYETTCRFVAIAWLRGPHANASPFPASSFLQYSARGLRASAVGNDQRLSHAI